jgi:hypothetical protein
MGEYIWIRMGDGAEYEAYSSPYEAGEYIGDLLACLEGENTARHLISKPKFTALGVSFPSVFEGHNYISLYWGDRGAQPIRALTEKEREEFKRGLRHGGNYV